MPYIYINIISKRWTIKPISRFNRSPTKEVNRVPNNERYVKSRSDFAYS
ncbi:unnamed protein product [Arabidopsis halleri]